MFRLRGEGQSGPATFWISLAIPTVNASTRKLAGSPDLSHARRVVDDPVTTSSMPEKSALDSDVRLTSS